MFFLTEPIGKYLSSVVDNDPKITIYKRFMIRTYTESVTRTQEAFDDPNKQGCLLLLLGIFPIVKMVLNFPKCRKSLLFLLFCK